MHSQFSAAALLALTFAAQVSGQTPSVPPTKTTAQPGDLMLTGCLQSSKGDTTAGDSKGNIYTLTVAAPATPPAPASPARSTTPASPEIYTLTAAEALGLAKHVGHQVQLTGRLQAPLTPQKVPATSGATSAGTASAGKPGGAHRTFEVTSLKMIASKCAP